MSVKNMAEASQAAAEFEPIPVQTRGGTVYVDKLGWVSFKSIWRDIQGLVGSGIRAWNAYASEQEAGAMLRESVGVNLKLTGTPDGFEYQPLDADAYKSITEVTYSLKQRADDGFAASIEEIMGKATEVPGLIERVIGGCCFVEQEGELKPLPADFFSTQKTDDVLRLFKEALSVNYSSEIQGFFGDAVQLWQPDRGSALQVTTTTTES